MPGMWADCGGGCVVRGLGEWADLVAQAGGLREGMRAAVGKRAGQEWMGWAGGMRRRQQDVVLQLT